MNPTLEIAAVFALALAAMARAQDGQDETVAETRSFSIPDTRAARELIDGAKEHLAARRFGPALLDLQRILEEHSSDLLSAERPTAEGDVHPGAANAVRRLLFAQPAEVRKLYVERHEPDARRALATARARADVRALAEIGRRWPLTPAGEDAWWSLGDVEFERGEPAEAARAFGRALQAALCDVDLPLGDAAEWNRALARLVERRGASDGIARRVATAIEVIGAGAGPRARLAAQRSLRTIGPLEGHGPSPSISSDAWRARFQLAQHPLRSFPRADALFGVRSGDRLFVSTSMRLYALEAYTGESAWDSGEPRGWSALSDDERNKRTKGVDQESLLVAPAASDHVVVAALQTPFSFNPYFQYQGQIGVTTPIPERRLYAYDTDTGRLLWSHEPPLDWDGESGAFETRMSVAGPPVIAGTRVLVPCVRLQGRIDYHVGCFDLETGERLWSTPVISGQRELNMFGRHEHEFSAPPLRVEGDVVIAQTQLGGIAALDLFSGEMRWQTLYPQVALAKTSNFTAPRRFSPWRNAAPVVAAGVVVATPFDSQFACAFDLATGACLWTLRYDFVNSLSGPGGNSVDLLLGADETTLYFAGERCVAIEFPSGLRQDRLLRTRWKFDDDELSTGRFGRPALGADRIVVPTSEGRIEIDRASGARVASAPWPFEKGSGNALLGPGELFVVGSGSVGALFDWDVLLARAERAFAEAPLDARRALELARLLGGRGEAEWSAGASDASRAHLTRARGVLEDTLRRDGGAARGDLAAELHRVLRTEARVRASLADAAGALTALHAARELAPQREALRDTLLEEIAVLGDARRTERAAAIDELERTCGDLALACVAVPAGALDEPGLGPRLVPLAGAHAPEPSEPIEIAVGAWCALERARDRARARDTAGELDALHSILARHADVELAATTAGRLATDRIAALVEAGGAVAYAPFEARAQALLEEARQANDRDALERVPLLYPLAQAARSASSALLALALDGGDLAEITRLVRAELGGAWRPGDTDERQARLLLQLVRGAGRAQNHALACALLESLARTHASLRSDLAEHGGRTVAELASACATGAPRAPAPATFGAEPTERDVIGGDFEILGAVANASGERELVVVQRGESGGRAATLASFSSAEPEVARWTLDLPPSILASTGGESAWTRRTALLDGRAVLATNGAVLGVDLAEGKLAWSWRPSREAEALLVSGGEGVAVAVVTPDGERDRRYAVGIDVQSGAQLWREPLSDGTYARTAILGAARAVFMPASGHRNVLVLDLATGARTLRFELPSSVADKAEQDAWLEGDALVVPWFEMRKERSLVASFDLADGRERWRVTLAGERDDEKRVLANVLQQDGRTYLVVQPVPVGGGAPVGPSVEELDTRIGARTPLAHVRLGPGDRILGVAGARRLELRDGPLFVRSPRDGERDGGADERLRAIDLSRGDLWTTGLRVPSNQIGTCAVPAVSDSTVAFAFAVTDPRRGAGSQRTQLVLLDRASGLVRDVRELARGDRSSSLQLWGLGRALFARTRQQLEILR